MTRPGVGLSLAEHLSATQAAGGLSFHMPGHKGGSGAPPAGLEALGRACYEADVSELGGFDYLHDARTGVAQAQARAAAAFGASRTWFLVGGATIGNIAAICSTVGDGEKLLVARASHRSVYAGIWASGAVPVYLPPVRNDPLDGLFGVDADDVRTALAAHPDIRAIHVTTPSMYGFTIPLQEIAGIADDHDVALIVDEAHGTHFAFHPDLPATALSLGADVVIHSPHKALGSLTQSAVIHHQGRRVDPNQLDGSLQMLQSSSPSALLLVSLATSIDEMAFRGAEHWGRVLELAHRARARLAEDGRFTVHGAEIAGAPGIDAYDPAKLVIDTAGTGLSGYAADRWLIENRGVRAETADLRRLVFSLTAADGAETVEMLVSALRELAESNGGHRHLASIAARWPLALPTLALPPRIAAQAPVRTLTLREAVGEVATEMIVPYPPGIPLLAPGEIVSAGVIDSLMQLREAGSRIVGMASPETATLRCVDQRSAATAWLTGMQSTPSASATAG